MTAEQFREFHDARPFVPFAIHLADQRVLGALHPEMAAWSIEKRTLAVENVDGFMESIDLRLIVSLRPFNESEKRARIPIRRYV
jgi:hypothetical protein